MVASNAERKKVLAEEGSFNLYINNVKEEIIRARLKAFRGPSLLPHIEVFNNIIDYSNGAQGKFLRPLLCISVCDSLNGNHEEGIHLGAGIELIHAGSLTHDDIIDDDLYRRGKLTIHEKFYVKPAILFGDTLFVAGAASIRTIPESHKTPAFEEFMDAFGRVSAGAMRENFRNPWDEREYIEVIKLKTAALFRASARLGAISSDASLDTKELIGEFGELVGTAYQIADDIIDIKKSINEQVPIGDVKEGKVTLPIIHLKNNHPELASILNDYSRGVDDYSNMSSVFSIMDEGIEYSQNKITKILNDANSLLDHIPLANGGREILQKYGEYIVQSMLKELD